MHSAMEPAGLAVDARSVKGQAIKGDRSRGSRCPIPRRLGSARIYATGWGFDDALSAPPFSYRLSEDREFLRLPASTLLRNLHRDPVVAVKIGAP